MTIEILAGGTRPVSPWVLVKGTYPVLTLKEVVKSGRQHGVDGYVTAGHRFVPGSAVVARWVREPDAWALRAAKKRARQAWEKTRPAEARQEADAAEEATARAWRKARTAEGKRPPSTRPINRAAVGELSNVDKED